MEGFYHLTVKMIGRSSGQAIVASAAYRAGEILRDERYGKTYDYSPRRGIHHKGILAPENAPDWALSRELLWNRVEARENRKDAQLAREFELALPHQISLKERSMMVETFIREQLIPHGMVVDYAIHAPNRRGDQRNWHAHLLTTLRPLEGGDLSALKDRDACKPEMIHQWREAWAEIQNRTFERLDLRDETGNPLRVDHRSFLARGIDREPTQHMGVHATAMERKGEITDRGDQNRAITALNENRIHRRVSQFVTRDEISDAFERPGKYRPERSSRVDKDGPGDRDLS
ncbi:MAG TPA: MobQ family relaxase [Fimbriimonadaceae bacterium]|jgi:ATP-dependent exoDNAse (exonuclease V) alpha subunit